MGTVDEMRQALEDVVSRPEKARAVFRKHGYVFERAPSDAIKRLPELSDGEAFYLYTDLLELAQKAEHALEDDQDATPSTIGDEG